ncbi:MAG: PQQ-like beta-propeller repeat protein [Verrucomicrobiae bacterium]|nr:PQQ-like beta-propeller repeat protein [Verrucomicrobiae bacterium]
MPNSQKPLCLTVLLLGFSAPALVLAEPWPDPAPPTVAEVPADTVAPVAGEFDRLKFHAAPKPLPEGAVTEDWPRFLGPNDDGTTGETKLLKKFPEGGPKVVWEMEKGTGYTSAIIADGRLVFFDRIDDEERIDCLDPETGQRFWSFAYPVEYRDRYGFNNGPRASAVLNAGKVYTLGVTSMLTCLDLKTGTKLWQRDLDAEFDVAPYFFGHGSCPIVYDGKVIVNLGGAGDLCVAAFDQHSGKLVWGTKHVWKSSYASPVVKTLRGEPRLLVFAGGESDPPVGGLLCIDPATGVLHDAYPWRADKYESVNGSTPVVVGENHVYVSDCYEKGGVMLELSEDLKWQEVWKAPEFGIHFTTPLVKDGFLYGFRGRNEPDAWLACFDAATGKEKWREDPEWSIEIPGGREYRLRYFRGNLLQADGRTWALGELGTLAMFNLSPDGFESVDRTQLFLARATWSLPVLHHGLLYVSQHELNNLDGTPPRLICYDLRAEE